MANYKIKIDLLKLNGAFVKDIQGKTTHEVLAVFESMKVAMRETGVNKVTISIVCRGKRKIGGGYIWRYAAKFI